MAALLPAAKWRLPKNDGTNAAGWVVKTYTPGGPVTGKATYTTAAAAVSNGAQFTLDARGEADVWWNGLYYIEVYNSAAEGGALVWSMDNYGAVSETVTAITTPTTLTTADSGKFVTTTADITLPDADAAGAGWRVTIKNISAVSVAIRRTTSTDTIESTAADLDLAPGMSGMFVVNNGETGFDVFYGDISALGAGQSGQILMVGNDGPEWQSVNLSNAGSKLYLYDNFT
jgi:hypothetical protein